MDQRHSGMIQIFGRFGEKSREVLSKLQHGTHTRYRAIVAREIMPTIDKCDLVKLKSFHAVPEAVHQENGQPAEWVKISVTCVSKRELISPTHTNNSGNCTIGNQGDQWVGRWGLWGGLWGSRGEALAALDSWHLSKRPGVMKSASDSSTADTGWSRDSLTSQSGLIDEAQATKIP